jgi:hypothetical protein
MAGSSWTGSLHGSPSLWQKLLHNGRTIYVLASPATTVEVQPTISHTFVMTAQASVASLQVSPYICSALPDAQ